MITISERRLRNAGAYWAGSYIKLPASDLWDKHNPESSNNGNYRSYHEFIFDVRGYAHRYSMSYHGDIEPFPEWETVSEREWEWLLCLAILTAEKLKPAETP